MVLTHEIDHLDLMGPDEMSDPALSAQKLLSGSRCRRYALFEPPFFIASHYEDVERILREPQTFLSGHGQGPNFAPPSGVVSDPPSHTFFRRLVQEDFLPRTIGQLRPRLEAIADELLDAVDGRGAWDLHDDLAFPLPVTIICEIFGVPTDDIGQFKRWSDASVAALSAQDPTEYLVEMGRMRAYVLELRHKKREEGDDQRLLARIARARLDGEYLSDEEAVGLVLQLFVAGNETTTSLITHFVWRMLSHDAMWEDFCAGRIDLELAINESLRFDPPLLGLFRTTARQVEIGGTSIPAACSKATRSPIIACAWRGARNGGCREDPKPAPTSVSWLPPSADSTFTISRNCRSAATPAGAGDRDRPSARRCSTSTRISQGMPTRTRISATVVAAATALVVDNALGPSRFEGQMGPGPGLGPGPDPSAGRPLA